MKYFNVNIEEIPNKRNLQNLNTPSISNIPLPDEKELDFLNTNLSNKGKRT